MALLGAAGGIGQPLALLLKMNKLITDLALYDIMGVAGVAADISHCNTPVKVAGFTGEAELAAALKGAEVSRVQCARARPWPTLVHGCMPAMHPCSL